MSNQIKVYLNGDYTIKRLLEIIKEKQPKKSVEEEINDYLGKSYEIGEAQMIVIARKILQENKNLKWFYSAMGTWFFTTKKYDENLSSNDLHYHSYLQPMVDFMSKWDDKLNLTGAGIRFTANGKIENKW